MRLRPIEGVFALDNGSPSPEQVFAERVFDFWSCGFFMLFPFPLLT